MAWPLPLYFVLASSFILLQSCNGRHMFCFDTTTCSVHLNFVCKWCSYSSIDLVVHGKLFCIRCLFEFQSITTCLGVVENMHTKDQVRRISIDMFPGIHFWRKTKIENTDLELIIFNVNASSNRRGSCPYFKCIHEDNIVSFVDR